MQPKRESPPSELRYCPECRAPIYEGKAEAHAELHWPAGTPPNRISADAIKRRDAVRAGGVRKEDLP